MIILHNITYYYNNNNFYDRSLDYTVINFLYSFIHTPSKKKKKKKTIF